MGLGISMEAVAAYIIALALLYLIGRLMLAPLKFILKLMLNAFAGGIILLILNLFGEGIGIHIGINPITALITGFFGIPGIILLLLLKLILV